MRVCVCVVVLFILIKQIHKCVNNHRGLIADYVAGPEECREFAHGANTLYGILYVWEILFIFDMAHSGCTLKSKSTIS